MYFKGLYAGHDQATAIDVAIRKVRMFLDTEKRTEGLTAAITQLQRVSHPDFRKEWDRLNAAIDLDIEDSYRSDLVRFHKAAFCRQLDATVEKQIKEQQRHDRSK